ncbi:hypothetical protein FFI97_019475 [Variovorax sp. KBS0712]|uniref:hypothetical protein n=1 Tax=Variovorax sp. KBS0712 TaxID=2578111 RepID=UPI00111BC16B|nr:hypothetical protein [Variovorax sp. KBS0712]TSD56415.1 hypothetical protein FFI97_019475 [Variovorax sp. KBS0712]
MTLGRFASASVGASLLAMLLSACANGPSVQLTSATGDELQRASRQLGSEELQQLVRPGSKVVRRTPEGYFHFWTNEPDGTFVSHTESSFFWGRGKWLVHDNTYCVRIEWNSKDFGRTVNEAYCYGIYAKGDRLFQGPPMITPAMTSQKFGEIRFSN